MEHLTIYKNRDESQPQTFSGRTVKSVLDKFSDWLDKNNGEFDSRQGWKAVYADGAFIITGEHPHDGPTGYTLLWDECYDNWQIEHDDGYVEDFDTWESARDNFVDIAKSFGDWA